MNCLHPKQRLKKLCVKILTLYRKVLRWWVQIHQDIFKASFLRKTPHIATLKNLYDSSVECCSKVLRLWFFRPNIWGKFKKKNEKTESLKKFFLHRYQLVAEKLTTVWKSVVPVASKVSLGLHTEGPTSVSKSAHRVDFRGKIETSEAKKTQWLQVCEGDRKPEWVSGFKADILKKAVELREKIC